MDVITFPLNQQTTSGLSILLHGGPSGPNPIIPRFSCWDFIAWCYITVRRDVMW